MPFTPFHFGPHACASLPLYRRLDIPVFIGTNVVIDLEPLLVMTFGLHYPLHGYCHTLLVGGLAGLLLATAAFPFRRLFGEAMTFLRLPYEPTYKKMAFSGVLGAWLHVLFDAPLYNDIRPFYPLRTNPLLGVISSKTVYIVCSACFLPALVLYIYVAFMEKRAQRKSR